MSASTLNPQQRMAVETIDGPVLILAGAGTGKTRVITHRIAHLIHRGIQPGHILGVTFTNKAAREMRERVAKLLPRQTQSETRGHKPDPPTLCTFHSLCVRILRQHVEKLGYKRNFVIYNESEQIGIIKKILARISGGGEKTDPAAILSLLSRFRNGGERAAVFGDPSVRAMAEHVRARYESALRACNAVDFDDLILLTLRLFDEHADALAACRKRYRYVMVDEYQDTNAAQFKLVRALTEQHRNLCVVGDDDQSIYGWRGAEIANLLEMERYFPDVKVVRLEQNYRSSNTILNAANAIIRHNVRRRPKRLWSQNGAGPKILLHTFTDEEQEARGVIDEIAYARLARRIPWAHQAILFRTNAQSRPLETALRQAGVHYHLIGGQSFFDRREIRDFLAYLKVFVNPHDDVSLLRIANTPARGLSDTTMERLLAASHERKCPVFDVMNIPSVLATFQARTRQAIEQFAQFIQRTRGFLTRPAGTLPAGFSLQKWADHFLDEIGYYNDLRRMEKNPENAESRIRSIQELLVTMDQTDAESRTLPPPGSGLDSLQAFLEEITLDTDREDEEKAGDGVTLITMHSCKGLEFPHVHIVGMEDGLLPHSRSKEENTLDEERRLFYVAVTRAMKTLAITHCTGRKRYGKLLPCLPSPFLKDLPPELVELADDKARQPATPAAAKGAFDVMRQAIE